MEQPREHQPVKGVLLVASALFFLATMDAATKFLSQSMAVPLLLGIRYGVTALLVVGVFLPRVGLAGFRTRRTGLVVLRSLCLVTSSLVFATGLKSIGLAEATSIVFTGPILLMFAGRAFLKETIGILGWIAAVLGFAGVLLVVRPGGGVDLTGAMLVAVSSALSAVYHLMSRTLARTETTVAMMVYANVIGAVVFGSTVPGLWPAEGLTGAQIGLLAVSGVLAAVGHFMITAAYRYAPASLLAPANYVQLLWTVLLGLVVFGTVPDALAALGMLAIAAAGLLTAFRARLQAS
ncbi:DMT family transporter [uncultured Alsobacter sp.]|uniref:DMT family transporter n=1 Tax=uncultured Alsobacter sp. TaxID=1748258 RepID=UPI0025D43AFF|nr:DMT family transporter [uncultured Alsobacter sp.]